jgi:hypothetical protein
MHLIFALFLFDSKAFSRRSCIMTVPTLKTDGSKRLECRLRVRSCRRAAKSQGPLCAISGHLPVRLLAVTGRRNFVACSLVDGR